MDDKPSKRILFYTSEVTVNILWEIILVNLQNFSDTNRMITLLHKDLRKFN